VNSTFSAYVTHSALVLSIRKEARTRIERHGMPEPYLLSPVQEECYMVYSRPSKRHLGRRQCSLDLWCAFG